MSAFISFAQLEYVLRLVISAACGMLIGFERKNRMKEAGIRTHMIVAIGSALMMIVSKYGFFDLAAYAQYSSLLKVDASRIASQIVTGIGFLGAGVIFVRNQNITGLTTAAGIWSTAGIGMAVGAGMYGIGIAATLLILLTQYLMRWDNQFPRFMPATSAELSVQLLPDNANLSQMINLIHRSGSAVVSMSVSHKKAKMRVELHVRLPQGKESASLVEALNREPYVLSVKN
jgi:putative Mg2+ transporter-C (MgtC) family protein